MSSRKSRQLFNEGDIVGNYKIVKLIGQGGYGDIYTVQKAFDDSDQTLYAMKLESIAAEKRGLEEEIAILNEIQDSQYFPHLYEKGITQSHRYLLMELLGPSVSNTRRQTPLHHFTMGTVLRLGIYMIQCIQSFHMHGFVHRDIKPGNFLLRHVPQNGQIIKGNDGKKDQNEKTNQFDRKSDDQSDDKSDNQKNQDHNNNTNNINSDNNNTNNNMNNNNNNDTNNNMNNNNNSNNNYSVNNSIHSNVNKTVNRHNISNVNGNNLCPLVLIDFGLSKRYIDPETGRPFPEKSRTGFRGTSKYASISAHSFHDQCPRDDLISCLYSLVELIEGRLPWGNIRDNVKLHRIKAQTAPRSLFRSLPSEFLEMFRYLNTLGYMSVPRYDYLIQLLAQPFYGRLRYSPKMPFDWETFSEARVREYSPIPVLPRAEDVAPPPRGLTLINDDEDKEPGSRCAACIIS
ncbi:hypothetical protein TRFO_39207 [Tritrichomonas foetus]|uniref:non-specific serine/threonine protein kinase n=1 Tax=Tritrichomonas foetus TaxID=1144522 RepID=A0A1J4J5Z3_9EUKA|nr:hypothetical protein TRFO_39207 [Tritrichomonas foetus]|eukprot:OHS94650.1 hypothetical protein TRFO_39207 [Tritrichomonas foetus]